MAAQRMDGNARRAQIVAVARRLFADGGYRSTTTRQLARAAGVSDALLYRHFRNKEDVLRAVVDDAIAGFAALRDGAAVARDRPLAERLTALGISFVRVLDAQVDVLLLFAVEHRLLADDARLAGFIDRAAGGLGDEIAARAAAGELRPGIDGYLFARSFMGSLVSFVLLQRGLGMGRVHPVAAADFIAALVGVYAHGARP